MARRRLSQAIDVSDSMANLVLVVLIGLIGMLLALIVWLRVGASGSPQQAQPVDDAAETVDGVQRPPGAEDGVQRPPGAEDGVRRPPGAEDGALERGTGADGAPDVGDGTGGTTDDGLAPDAATEGDPGSDDATGDGVAADGPDDGVGADDAPDDATAPDDPPAAGPQLVVGDVPRDIHTTLVDLDGDGVDETVTAALVSNAVRVTVERLTDDGWVVVDRDWGVVADDLVALRVSDLTGDGDPEIHTLQRVARWGERATIWAWDDGELRSLPASGGCWNGSNTFGVVGVLVAPGQVTATCDDAPLPFHQWSSDVYEWRDGRWSYIETFGAARS